MKAKFICIGNSIQTEEFELDNNPFKIGETVDLTCFTTRKIYDENLKTERIVDKYQNDTNGLFKIVDIIHNVSVQTIISTNFKHTFINIFIEPLNN